MSLTNESKQNKMIIWKYFLPSLSLHLLIPGSHNKSSWLDSCVGLQYGDLNGGMVHWNCGPIFICGVESDSGGIDSLLHALKWSSLSIN